MIPAAPESYSREIIQQAFNKIIELEKKLNALSEYVPQTDITAGTNKKLVIDAGVVTVVDP